MERKKKGFIFILLDIILLVFYFSLFGWAIIDHKIITLGTPVIFIVTGMAFIVSNKLKEISMIERFFYWVSYNIFVPRSKMNHVVWGCAFVILGVFFTFNNKVIENTTNFEKSTNGVEGFWYADPLLWIVIGLIIAISFYRYKK